MALVVLDAATAAAVAATTDREANIAALVAPWAGGNVTVRVLAGSTLLATLTQGSWVAGPTSATLGTRQARTFVTTGTPTRVVFRAGSTDIFELSAGVGSGDVSFAAGITSAALERIDGLVVNARSSIGLNTVTGGAELSITSVALASSVTTPGFQTLATFSTSLDFYGLFRGHQGSVYVPERRAWWLFGAETHNSAEQFTNSPYHLDLATNRLYRDRAIDAWPGQYRFDSAGRAFATAAKDTPWAMHGQRQLPRIPGRPHWTIAYPSSEHAFWTGQILEGAVSTERPMLWDYNCNTLTWDYDDGGANFAAVSSFLAGNVGYAVAYHPTRNSLVTAIDLSLRELNLSDLTYRTVATSVNGSFNTFGFVLTDGRFMFCGGNIGDTTLVGFVNVATGASTSITKASVAALSSVNTRHAPWVRIGETDQFILFAKDVANSGFEAFRFNAATEVFTATGHTWSASSGAISTDNYSLLADWASDYGVAIMGTQDPAGNIAVVAYRPA